MSKDSIEEYRGLPGAASLEAGRAVHASPEEALEKARLAALDGDLLHPRMWDSWKGAPDEVFEEALKMISPAEIKRLEVANGQWGGNWAAVFDSPEKLRALAALGLDPSRPACKARGGELEAAVYSCLAGSVANLAAMADAGFKPPGRLARETGIAMDELRPTTPLQALAVSSLMDLKIRALGAETFKKAIAWLCSEGVGIGERNALGEDALKLAIRRGEAALAELLIAMGARAEEKNERGQSALEALRETVGEMPEGTQKAWLLGLEPRILSIIEAVELERGPEAAASARGRVRV